MTTPDSPARIHFEPGAMETRAFYRVLNSVVVPRPIAWVCSRSADGVLNLAPHSFYTVACVDPPVVQFTSVGRKDSLRNVEATGEFTVSLTPESLFEQVNATGTDFPAGLSEADQCGVGLEPSEVVGVPRVALSPVAWPGLDHPLRRSVAGHRRRKLAWRGRPAAVPRDLTPDARAPEDPASADRR